MKARLHFDSFGHVCNLPQAAREEHFKRSGVAHHAKLPAGTIIDHPDAWQLVRNGHAEPADEECRIAAAMTQAEMDAAKARYQRIAVGRGTGLKKYDAPPPAAEVQSMADAAVQSMAAAAV